MLVLSEDSACFRAMAASCPVLCDRLDGELPSDRPLSPAVRTIVASYTSFLAVPLAARGAVVGCAVFGRTEASSGFGPDDL